MNAFELTSHATSSAARGSVRAQRTSTATAAMLNAHESDGHREEELAGDDVRRGDDEHPERVGVGLHALVGVEREAVAVNEVPDRPERDVRVVAHPGVREKDVAEEHEQGRAGQPGDAGVVRTRGRARRGQARNHGFTMPA